MHFLKYPFPTCRKPKMLSIAPFCFNLFLCFKNNEKSASRLQKLSVVKTLLGAQKIKVIN